MLQNYLKTGLRFLLKRKGFSIVNVTGLSIGITACLLISWYVRFHNEYDKQIPNFDRVYRVLYQRWSETGDRVRFASASPTIGPSIKMEFPEIQEYGRAYKIEGVFFNKDIFFEENSAFYGETNTLKLLGFEVVKGDKETNLDAPRKVAISESTAKKYFGNDDPIGKNLNFNKTTELEVTAVYKDRESDFHFKPNIIVSLATWMDANPKIFSEGWFYSGFYTYVRIKEGVNPNDINKKIEQLIDKQLGEILREYKMGMSFELQPLKDIHLTSHFMHEIEPNGDKTSIALLEIVAWFILLIAWVNFFNLSTISSLKRIREIGIRKVVGASRVSLILQFLLESFVINLIAILISLILFEVTQPVFANMAGLPVTTNLFFESWFILTILLALAIGTVSSGIYSVSGIASSSIISVIKGISLGVSKKSGLKKVLVTFQFAIAIALIAGTIGVFNQYRYISKRELGFNKNNMLVVKAPVVGDTSLIRKFWVYEQEIKSKANVKGVTFSSIIPGKPNMFNRGGIYRYGDDPNNSKNYRVTEADSHYLSVYCLKLLAGDGFTGITSTDKNLVVVNKMAALQMGFVNEQEAIGKEIVMEGQTFRIAGVIIDFFQLSPKEPIEPQIFRYPRRFQGYFTINYDGKDVSSIMHTIESTYKELFPNNPFDYFYLDQFYNKQFQYERRFGFVFMLFSVLSVVITVLGLLSLSAFTSEMRRKEIGVRKVLGASVLSLIKMLYTEYVLLMIVASLIALPAVFIFLKKWLVSFALKSDLSVWIFIIPIVLVAIISSLTVSIQSFKAANQNPVESIKYE